CTEIFLKLRYTAFYGPSSFYPMVIRLFFILLILVTAELRTQSLTIGIAANDSRADKNHFLDLISNS
ncbi:hypothetical protein, partial [Legionella pneumophila]|uniref:hypothetical protein n=1 Tax=Legionella pneumophila TaxID=446 RepID=UPI000ACD4211